MSSLAQRLGLSEQAPSGRRALRSGLLWLAVAMIAMAGAMLVAVNLTSSVVLRIVIGIAFVISS
jgi:hypothetical protein